MSEGGTLFDGLDTLAEARAKVERLRPDGSRCPCCGQLAKTYKRKVNSGMARSLIEMWKVGRDGWVHLPTQIGARSREEGKLRYWGLVEEQRDVRADGGRAGYWRVTDNGWAFLHDSLKVQKYALIYDGQCIGFDGPLVGIRDALGSRFSYDELMATPEGR